MNHRRIIHVIIGLTCLSAALVPGATTPFLSPSDIVASPNGHRLYVALHTGRAVAVIDPQENRVLSTIALPYAPQAVAISKGGDTLFVAGGGAQGSVSLVDTAAGRIKSTIPVGHTPSAVVISPTGQLLYVCHQFDRTVAVIDLGTQTVIATLPVLRDPVAMALSPDGVWLLVCHLLPDGAADGPYTAAKVSLIDTRTQRRVKDIDLPNGSTGVRDICLSPDGQYGYVTHILARYQLPTTQLERGWMNTNALTILNVKQQTYVTTVLLDDVDRGAANPWGLACTEDGQHLVITLSGTRELCVIDRVALHDRLARVAKGERVTEVSASASEVPNDLAFTLDIKQRFKLLGEGPRSVAIIKNMAYVAEYFTDSVSVLDLTARSDNSLRSIRLRPNQALTPARVGEHLFHDASLCFQSWQSCSTCHPDARMDALNWDLLNDGLGNPKNTKSLLMAHATPPAMATGIRPTAEAAVRAGMQHILFSVLPDAEAVAIDTYLKSLTPVPSPCLIQGRLSESAQRGKAVFKAAGCAGCHPPPLYTNQEQWPVGTGRGREENTAFDTPTLIEIWRTAPYLHDGRAATLKEVVTICNPNDRHGRTSDLSDQAIDDLTAYLLSL